MIQYDARKKSHGDVIYPLVAQATLSQVFTTSRPKTFEEVDAKIEQDEEAVEVGTAEIIGYQPTWWRKIIFWLFFFLIMAGLGYMSWAWARALFPDHPAGHYGGFSGVLVVCIGLEILFFRWYPGLYVRLQSKAVTLDVSPVVVVTATDESATPCPVTKDYDPSGAERRVFAFRHCKYVWEEYKKTFQVLSPDLPNFQQPKEPERVAGLSSAEAKDLLAWHGKNLIDVPLPSIPVLLMEEILHPFLWFQIFSMVLWCLEKYFYYSACVFILTVVSAAVGLMETRRNILDIRAMSHFECDVTVIRDEKEIRMSSSQVVPGDIVEIESDTTIPFDAVLLSGEAIINESMLTGESVPVVKVAYLGKGKRVSDIAKNSILYNGTYCIQAKASHHSGRKKALARVWKTGFSTAKGRLVRSILFPRPAKFSLYRDGFRFVGVLALLSVCGFSISIYEDVITGVPIQTIILYTLDLVTIAVPPALPTTLLIGMTHALTRLNKANMFCISPPRINVAGKVNLMCFDKTGTITEEGLDLHGVVPVHKKVFLPKVECDDVPKINTHGDEGQEALLTLMATCHQLRYVDRKDPETKELKRELIGDPLEVKMFEATGWDLVEPSAGEQSGEAFSLASVPPNGSNLIETRVLKTFEFSSQLQRMTVVAREMKEGTLMAMVKGAPEVIVSLSNPQTVPIETTETLKHYTKEGYRVLACAARSFDDSKASYDDLSQEEVEEKGSLTFMGLVIMENKIKPQSVPTINLLKEAKIGTVMITGDHALTAIHVARTCGIIPPSKTGAVFIADLADNGRVAWKDEHTDQVLSSETVRFLDLLPSRGRVFEIPDVSAVDASSRNKSKLSLVITGRAFEYFFKACIGHPDKESHLKWLSEKVVVAARFSPTQKQKLVELFSDNGYITGFCGDGANDCGALKSADAGLSLSPEAEASVAAPFTSKVTNIESVITLLREGRAALSTSFQCFKFMALYALVQYSGTLQAFLLDSYISDAMYLVSDLFIVLPIAIAMGYTAAWPTLSEKRPIATLMSPSVLFSIFGQTVICIGFQVGSRYLMKAQSWYQPQGYQADDEMSDDEVWNLPGYELTAIAMISNFQYVFSVMVFTISKPFRQPFWTNLYYTATCLWSIGISCYITLAANVDWLDNFLVIIPLDEYTFRPILLSLFVGNLIAMWIYEQVIAQFTAARGRVRQAQGARHIAERERALDEVLTERFTRSSSTSSNSRNSKREIKREY